MHVQSLAHVAFRIGDDLSVLRDAKGHLQAHGVNILRQVDHVVSQSIYFSDPDDNMLEVFVDADPQIWRQKPSPVASSDPLDL